MNPVYGQDTVVSDLVYSASAANVHTTIVDGEVLMENRQLKLIDVGQIVAKTRELAAQLIHG
jgi:cytosine/adenosine deaminase-related metal-dependent hydrolase